jgi:hypothetical protein
MEFFGEEILRLTGIERVTKHDDLADEYRIHADPEAMSGIVAYGRFGERWIANPSLRPVVRELLGRLGLLLDRCEHGYKDGEFCEECNRACKVANADPDNQ